MPGIAIYLMPIRTIGELPLFASRKNALRLAAAFIVAVYGLLGVTLCAKAQSASQRTESSDSERHRYFTVRDSIEMSRFERGGKPIFSPDKKYFAVVTSRDIIDSDEVESTLRVFKLKEVEEFLRNGNSAEQVASKVIARLTAVPKIDYVNSYAPIISKVEWTDDSRTLLFLAENSHKERQLYQADLVQRSLQAVTPRGYDVSQLSFSGGTIAYRASPSLQSPEIGKPVNGDVRVVNGIPLVEILFGERARRYSMYSELWMYRDGRNVRITDSSTKLSVSLFNSPPVYPGLNPLSVSPDGRLAVALLPVSFIPKSWESYTSDVPSLKFDSKDSSAIEGSSWERPTEYTLIDLNSGKLTPLLHAPNGWLLGYAHRNLAVWSIRRKNIAVDEQLSSLG